MSTKKKVAKKAVAKPAAPKAKAKPAPRAAKQSAVTTSECGLITTRTYPDGQVSVLTHQTPQAAKEYADSVK